MTNRKSRIDHWAHWAGLGLALIVAAGCNGTTTATYAYDDPYLYATYYPSDLTYAGYYWADDWNTSTFYYYYVGGAVIPIAADGAVGSLASDAGLVADGGRAFDAGADGGAGSSTPVGLSGAIEALARGQSVCPGQVTVTPRTASPACAGGPNATVRNGVTIVFNNCQVGNDTLSGTFDVVSMRSASSATCSSSTVISLQTTTTMTNLSVTNARGTTLAIPTATETGMTSYTFGGTPSTIQVANSGQLQLTGSKGATVVDISFNGSDNYTLQGSRSYSIDGTTALQDKNGGTTSTVTKTGLTRSAACCRPTAGSVTINRTGGGEAGQATWSFGPSCGSVARNGTNVSLPACIDD